MKKNRTLIVLSQICFIVGMLLLSCDKDDPIVAEVTAEENLAFDASGGAKTITIYANCEWELISELDWVSFSMESGSGDAEVVVTLAENVSVNKREGKVEIRYEGGNFPVIVAQEGFEAIILNEKGSANSYLVNSGVGLYAIEAVYKGNSKTEKIDEWSFASLVWQDENGLITGIKTNLEENLILIDVADKAGNAVLAVHDQGGIILWSWHLWVTDFNPETSEFTTPEEYANGTKWVFMDRHLGAIDHTPGSIEALGLLYQWGRKDPFTASAAFTEQNRELYDIDGKNLDDFVTTASKNGTLELSIQNPDIFYLVSYKTGDWCDDSNDNLWGGVSMQKTIYDPCPVGWKVPVSDESGKTPYGFLSRNNTKWVNNGRLYADTDWWLAASGTRVLETGEVHIDAFGDAYGGIWTGTHGKANPDPEYPALYGQYMFVGSGRLASVMKDSRSQGMSVRCVRE